MHTFRPLPACAFAVMKRRLFEKHADSGSALVLVLLVIALLTTTVVGFLSTARIEQLAARNFSNQNAATGLAELATQQAMAKIALGFNTTGNLTGNYTSVVTTQPGAIHKYFFQNGTVTQNTTVELFSSGNLTVNSTSTPLAGNSSAEIANLNNLSNPVGNATSTLSLTGNSSEEINVNMEEIRDAEGNLVGRIAYYIDDELTKININAATENRSTLNVSTPRSMSLSAFTTGNLTNFRNTIDGSGSSTSDITNWGHFFRDEQAAGVTGFSGNQMSNISTAPLSDFHLKYTPWGARRLHINDQAEVPLNSTGVDIVYNSLNSTFLRNIYGQTFNDKYGQPWSWTGNMAQTSNTTVNGLKQTIANMLQMRTPGSHDIPTVQSSYTGPVISENGTATFPPSGYYADIPTGCINEFGFKINYSDYDEGPGGGRGILLYPMPIIEFLFASYYPYGNTGVYLEATIQSLTFTLRDSLGNTTNRTIGPFTLSRPFTLLDAIKFVTNGSVGNRLPYWCQLTSEQYILNDTDTPDFDGNNNLPWSIVGNPTLVMGDVKLFAGSSNSSDALRDWLTGSFIMSKLGINGTIVLNTPIKTSSDHLNSEALANFSGNLTLQRIDSRVKGETAWAVAPYTYPRIGAAIYTQKTHNASSNSTGGHNTYYGGYGLRPSETETRDIPGDPSPMGAEEPDYFITTEHSWIYLPRKLYTLDSTGNATFNSPSDLGKVPTNVNWRRLRFMPRHQRENARNLIPDWAMLDVISFSSNSSSSSNLKIAPINPNGAFAVDTSINNGTISPRNNIPALVQALESTSDTDFQLGSALARTVSGSNMTFDKVDMRHQGTDFITFRGNTPFATSISSNITSNSSTKWSTENSTWSAWRTARNWPATSLILPGEVTEIRGVADYGRRSQYHSYQINSGSPAYRSIKENEGRLSAFFPGLTTCSNFFTIYAYAQAGQLQNKNQPESASNPFIADSEALTKTLVEVEITTPATETTPAQYKVKKLYTQPIPLGQ